MDPLRDIHVQVASISHDVCFYSGHAKGVLRLKQSAEAFPSVFSVVRSFDEMELDAGGCIDDFRQAKVVAFHLGLPESGSELFRTGPKFWFWFGVFAEPDRRSGSGFRSR
jgi:hypothetical protein